MNAIYCVLGTTWCLPVDAWASAGSWAQAIGTVLAILFAGVYARRQSAAERNLIRDQSRHATALKVAKVYIPAKMLLRSIEIECRFHDGRNPNARPGDHFFYKEEFVDSLTRIRVNLSEDLPLLASAAALQIDKIAATFPRELDRLRLGEVTDSSQLVGIAEELAPHVATLRVFAEYDF